jgi:hypothetical protein
VNEESGRIDTGFAIDARRIFTALSDDVIRERRDRGADGNPGLPPVPPWLVRRRQ